LINFKQKLTITNVFREQAMNGRDFESDDESTDLFNKIESLQRNQMKTNSRIVRASVIASVSSQVAILMILINSNSIITGAIGILIMIVHTFSIRKLSEVVGRNEWPKDELDHFRYSE
jgi:hypothetical protein